MTASMLNRRLVVVGAALGLPVALRKPAAAEETAGPSKMSCDYNLTVADWESRGYSTSCDFKTTATSEVLSLRVIRTSHEPDTWFELTVSDQPSLTLHFCNLILDPPIVLAELIGRIYVGGKLVWERNGRQPGIEAKHDSMKFSGAIDDVVTAMRQGASMRVELLYLSEEPLVTLEYTLRGFDSAYEEWEKQRAEVALKLQSGVECLPPGNPTCYFTTAACDAAGLPDDCFELTMLRCFRDTHMAGTAQGRAEIAEYYDRAPGILASIGRKPDARKRLARLYAFVVLPCAVLIRLGCHRTAYRLYRRSFTRLAERPETLVGKRYP